MLDGDRLTAPRSSATSPTRGALTELLRSGEPVPADLLESRAGPSADALVADPAATICSCNAVTVGEVQSAIRRGGLHTVAQAAHGTRATTGCGGCTRDVEALLSLEAAATRA